jgi:hypothetical protein
MRAHERKVISPARTASLVIFGLFAGCSEILGLDEFVDASGSGGAGGAGAGAGGATTSGGGAGAGEPPTVPVLRLPINDAYLGTMKKSGSRRPRFVWEASTSPSDTPIEYELQYSDDPAMSAATTVTTEKTEHQPDMDLEIALLPPVGRRYYWRVRACAQGACSEYSPLHWINVGRPKCDFDADGYDDVAISAYNVGTSIANAIYFYYGSVDGQFNMADSRVTFSPFGSGGGFGISLSCAGDVDGDGYADVLVGAPYVNKTYVYRGGERDRVTRDYFTLESTSAQGNLGTSAASAGDVNNDGFSDLIIGSSYIPIAQLYLGGKTGPSAPITLDLGESDPNPGTITSSAGDINGDGLSDIIVTFYFSTHTAVQIYLGNPGQGFDSTPKTVLVAPSDDSTFGYSIAAAGDVNGDGFGDIIVGSYGTDHAISISADLRVWMSHQA